MTGDIASRYRGLLRIANQQLTVDQAHDLHEQLLVWMHAFGAVEPDDAEHSGLAGLRAYAECKLALALEEDEHRRARRDLAEIEGQLFEELDALAGQDRIADVTARRGHLDELHARLGRITRSLPETDLLRGLVAFADGRYRAELERVERQQRRDGEVAEQRVRSIGPHAEA